MDVPSQMSYRILHDTKYLRMEQVKFVEDSLLLTWANHFITNPNTKSMKVRSNKIWQHIHVGNFDFSRRMIVVYVTYTANLFLAISCKPKKDKLKINFSLTFLKGQRFCLLPPKIYLFKVNNRSARKNCEMCSKLTIKIPERRYWRHSGVFIVNSEHTSRLF